MEDEGYGERFSFGCGQTIATPGDITLTDPQPYLGLLFCVGGGSLVARDMALDGNYLRDYDRDVDKKSFVRTFGIGLGYRDDDFGVDSW